MKLKTKLNKLKQEESCNSLKSYVIDQLERYDSDEEIKNFFQDMVGIWMAFEKEEQQVTGDLGLND